MQIFLFLPFQFFSMPNPSKLSGCRWGLGSGFQRRYQTKTNFWQIDALLIGSIIQIQVQEILVFARWVHKKQDVKASKVFFLTVMQVVYYGVILPKFLCDIFWYISLKFEMNTIKNQSNLIWTHQVWYDTFTVVCNIIPSLSSFEGWSQAESNFWWTNALLIFLIFQSRRWKPNFAANPAKPF